MVKLMIFIVAITLPTATISVVTYQMISQINLGRPIGGRTCAVENNNQLMIDGRFVRYLNANDLRQLADYQRKVDHWQKKLDLHIEHRVNAGENQRRQQMNAAFGPDGSYVKSFKGPFWEEQHLNTPPPTTLPTFAPEQIAEVPTEHYPDPPAFCLQ